MDSWEVGGKTVLHGGYDPEFMMKTSSHCLIAIVSEKPFENLSVESVFEVFAEFSQVRKASCVYRFFKNRESVRSVHDLRSIEVTEGYVLVLSADLKVEWAELAERLADAENELNSRTTAAHVTITVLMSDSQGLLIPPLTIPPVDLHERAEWLIPAAEVEPDIRHPVLEKSLSSLVRELQEPIGVRFYKMCSFPA